MRFGAGCAAFFSLAVSFASSAAPVEPVAPKQAAVAVAPVASVGPVEFDPAGLTPFFAQPPLGKAIERLRSGDAVAARDLVSEYVQTWRKEHNAQKKSTSGKATDSAMDEALDVRVRFLLALSLLKTAQTMPAGPERFATAQASAVHFAALATSYPLLFDYHVLYRAEALLLADKPLESLVEVARIRPESVLDCEARFLKGRGFVARAVAEPAQARHLREQAVGALSAYLSACGDGGKHKLDAQVRLAEQFDALARPAEALQWWRRIYLESPTEAAGTLAAKRLEQPGVKQPPFSASELLGRAQVLFDNMRNAESEAAFRLVLEQPDLDGKQKCEAAYHLAQSVFKQRQRPRAAPLFDQAVVACAPGSAKNDDLHIKSLYQGARCHASAGRLQVAADLFAVAERAHPTHSFADDARLRQAEMYRDLADRLVKDGPQKTCEAEQCPDYESKVEVLLSDLPTTFPDGDRRAEALWRLALPALQKNDLQTAQKWLKEALVKIPREVGWDQEGRTLYWLGRVAELNGERAAALEHYQNTARTYPLSFYALLAFGRLREGFPAEFDALLRELWADSAVEKPAFPVSFSKKPLYGMPGFLRGVELLRLGLGAEARREFAAVGLLVPLKKRDGASPKPDDAQTERLWLSSVLYERAGDWHRSHFVPRHVLTDWQTHHPQGVFRPAWLLGYPRGYSELLTQAAQTNGVPSALQFAIVREESAFDPLTESFANAIGLTQMIPPTAKRFSAGLPFHREVLRDPAINVAIGSRFLGFLWQTMKQNPALSVSGYNAGEGAVFRWLRKYADTKEIDLFVETIPYDETRGYTKRVLSSYFVYRWLEPQPDGTPMSFRVPELMFRLPPPPPVKTKPTATPNPPPAAP
ncbi:MAG TPA: transglycosylase SLT domain-containing protein [Pseudomonadota bacterium]|nr:transglycosylase SLT domain-containing protein [Pseudomonadota bacterium]